MDQSLPSKKGKLENGDSYIPTGVGGGPNTSLLFSLKDEKGALVKALKPFEVRKGGGEGRWGAIFSL